MKELIGDYEEFVAKIDWGIDEMGIDRADLTMMDHLCYRVETNRRYAEMYRRIGRVAELLSEVEINGRLIATFEFDEPLEVYGWRVPFLELPQPKRHSPFSEGLEHTEFVVASLEKFEAKHSDLPFTHVGMSKKINPELGLKNAGISVKFHEQSLGAVVRLENRLGIHD